MTQLPNGQQSEHIEANLKRLRGARLEGSQESKGNHNRFVTLCRKQRDVADKNMDSLRWREMITYFQNKSMHISH
jgi:hypothetical protein